MTEGSNRSDGAPAQAQEGAAASDGTAAARPAAATAPAEIDRIPLSWALDMWAGGAETAGFDPRFIMAEALRVRGRIDVAALQGALDDLVARHEMLRTFVVRDVRPAYQRVLPPSPVPLTVIDRPTADAAARDRIASELLNEAESSSLDVAELPLLRAALTRFDDTDSVLTLVNHHTAGDGWSFTVLTRDLAALYRARTTGEPAQLPEPGQYRDLVAWQQEHVSATSAKAMDYWHEQLRGARFFTLPTDRPTQSAPRDPYLAVSFNIDVDVMKAAAALASATRSSEFIVLLAGATVLAHHINGVTDTVINTLTAGRNQRQFRNTVGPFLNFLPLRTDIAPCGSFRDVVLAARKTMLGAYANELPIMHLEREFARLLHPLQDPMRADLIFGYYRPPRLQGEVRFADGVEPVRQIKQRSTQIPGGVGWNMMGLPSGEVLGKFQYNPAEFDDSTVGAWVSDYQRIVALATEEPDRDWRDLQPDLSTPRGDRR